MNGGPYSESTRGVMEFLIGLALLLYTLGIFERLFGTLLIMVSILLMVHGFMRADGFAKIKTFFGKKNSD